MHKQTIDDIRGLIGDLESAVLIDGKAPDTSVSVTVSADVLLDAITVLKALVERAEIENSLSRSVEHKI
ncbi:hypothetical protein [Pseudoxanthomonas mexicana]